MNVFNRLKLLNGFFNASKIQVASRFLPATSVTSGNKCFSTVVKTDPKNVESKLFSGFIPMDKIEITFSRSTGNS